MNYQDITFEEILDENNIPDWLKTVKYNYDLQEPIIKEGFIVDGSDEITFDNTYNLSQYMYVSGDGIPEDTIIEKIINSSTVKISNNATITDTIDITIKIKPKILRFLKSIYNILSELNNTTYSDIYLQNFITTATGEDLDIIGSDLNFKRNGGESDTSYRNRILAFILITNQGNPIKAVSEFIESLGYDVDSYEETYNTAFYTDSTGDNDYAYTGSGLIVERNWINYTCYFFLSATPSDSDITYLEEILENIKKVYNRVYIR